MDIGQKGLELIKSFESCRLKAYRDIVGVLTIGYGHTGEDVSPDLVITQDEANELLRSDLQRFCDGINDLLEVDVSQNQFDAMVSLAFNIGLGNFGKSLLIRCVNKNNMLDAGSQFARWDHAGGKTVPGLVRRRAAERALFLTA